MNFFFMTRLKVEFWGVNPNPKVHVIYCSNANPQALEKKKNEKENLVHQECSFSRPRLMDTL